MSDTAAADAFIHAQAFMDAVDIIDASRSDLLVDYSFKKLLLDFPLAVNSSLACELFLKSLLLQKGQNHKLHDLKKLFDCLDGQTRKDVTQKTIAILGVRYDERKFEHELSSQSNTFTEWRYAHETPETLNGCNLTFLRAFMEALSEASSV